ncbi:MAG TPA: ATP-binding protein [Gammaproteobacteria bacterium]|nr:ATP-binding protein [Gammaproteobacteria bacterium]
MGEVAYDLQKEAEHNVEIVVHVDESLDEGKRSDLVTALEESEGIYRVEFCPLRYHLMLVQYDRNRIASQDVLGKVTAQSIHAELIGPV